MLRIKARNVTLRKSDTIDRACGIVALFLGSTEKEEDLLKRFFETICAVSNRCLTSKDVAAFRRRHRIPGGPLNRPVSS